MLEPGVPLPEMEGHAKGSGRAVTLLVAAESASRLLPSGLELDSELESPAGEYPVTLLFVEQRDVEMTRPLEIEASDYRELIVAVDAVQRGGVGRRFW